ncbi:MAG: hypothetical protein ACE5EE_11505 [Fidelibacterota bacterium]
MGRLPSNNRRYEIEELQERHREILRRLALGQSAQEIARDLGITTAVVSYTKNSAIGRRELSIIQGARNSSAIRVSEQIKKIAPKALALLDSVLDRGREKIMNGDDPRNTEVKVALDMLDRAGHGAVKKFAGAIVSGSLSEEALERIKKRAEAAGVMIRKDEDITDAVEVSDAK